MSQLFAYIGRPGSVRTSRHLDSSACATQCLGHPGHPRTCQDTYQESGIVVTIQAVWNCPPNPDYCGPAGHAQCTILLYKPLHSTADYTCIRTLQIFTETVFCKWAKCLHSFQTFAYSRLCHFREASPARSSWR